jgi:hypothetical protein|tara:strand:+ start:370 stop:528 length:159 start_codon:yes stop_codon:yes gene_type:complete
MKIVIVSVICITILMSIALLMGINGTLLTTSVGVIAGLTGLATKTPRMLEKV